MKVQVGLPELKRYVRGMENLTNDCVSVRLDREGVKIAVVDPANVMAALLKLPSQQMDLETEEYRGFQIGVLSKFMSKLSKKEFPVVELDFKDKYTTSVKFWGDGEGIKFTIANCMDTDVHEKKFNFVSKVLEKFDREDSNKNVTAHVEISGKTFKRITALSKPISSKLIFVVEDEVFTAIGDDDETTFEYKVALKSPVKEKTKSAYTMDYLVDIARAVGYEDTVKLHFGTNFLLKVEIEKEDVGEVLSYLLAPRIEPE